jgi:hypothetical protein
MHAIGSLRMARPNVAVGNRNVQGIPIVNIWGPTLREPRPNIFCPNAIQKSGIEKNPAKSSAIAANRGIE